MFWQSKFRKIFGFNPSSVSGMRVNEQEMVDYEMESRAIEFYNADSREAQARSVRSGDLSSLEKELRTAQREVEKAKKNFWAAQEAAKEEGYLVGNTYKHHLPSYLRVLR